MNGWIQHEKKWGRFYMEIPAQVHGTGYAITNKDEPGKEFKLDKQTGLLLPETAARERRKVKTGFQPKDKDAA